MPDYDVVVIGAGNVRVETISYTQGDGFFAGILTNKPMIRPRGESVDPDRCTVRTKYLHKAHNDDCRSNNVTVVRPMPCELRFTIASQPEHAPNHGATIARHSPFMDTHTHGRSWYGTVSRMHMH